MSTRQVIGIAAIISIVVTCVILLILKGAEHDSSHSRENPQDVIVAENAEQDAQESGNGDSRILRVTFVDSRRRPVSAKANGICLLNDRYSWRYGREESIIIKLPKATFVNMDFVSRDFETAELQTSVVGGSKSNAPDKWRYRVSSADLWESPLIKKPLSLVLRLKCLSYTFFGRAFAADENMPIKSGTLIGRKPGQSFYSKLSQLSTKGEFSFKWERSERDIELTIISDEFPTPEWVSTPLRTQPEHKESATVIDIGTVAFEIPANGIWGKITGELPEDLRIDLLRFPNWRPQSANDPGAYTKSSKGYIDTSGELFYCWRDLPVQDHYCVELVWGTGPTVQRTEIFKIPKNDVVRKDFSFEGGSDVKGVVLFPFKKERPIIQSEGNSVLFVPGMLGHEAGNNMNIRPFVFLRSKATTTSFFLADLGSRSEFSFSYIPRGAYTLEVVFFEDYLIGRDVAFRTDIEVPLKHAGLEIDLSDLVPVKVIIKDPLILAQQPLHATCWTGLRGQILSGCTAILYSIESVGSEGDTRVLGVSFGHWALSHLNYYASNPIKKPLWGLLYLPPGTRSFRISRSLCWDIVKKEYTIPEACGATMATVSGPADTIDVTLEPPRRLRFLDGTQISLEKTAGELELSLQDTNRKQWQVVISGDGILETDEEGRIFKTEINLSGLFERRKIKEKQ